MRKQLISFAQVA